MGWNGSGTFNRTDGTRTGTQVWEDAKDAGVKIRADDHDTHDQDIADGLENTVAKDGQNTTTTDNAILRFDAGNSQFEGVSISDNEIVGRSGGDVTGVAISASEIVGRSASGNIRSLSAATARQTLGIGTAAPTNEQALFWASASSSYEQKSATEAINLLHFPNVNADVTATDEQLSAVIYSDVNTVIDATNGGSNDLETLEFTSIPSDARVIYLLFNDISLDGSGNLDVQIGDSGGYETSGYNSAGMAFQTSASGDAVASTSSFIMRGGFQSQSYSGMMVLTLLDASNNVWVESHNLSTTTPSIRTGSGGKSLSATLDRIRIKSTGASEAFDDGSVNLVVERFS